MRRVGDRALRRPQPGIAKRRIRRYIPDAPVIVEAGASNGSDTLEMIRHWPRAMIHAFEPVDESFAELTMATRDEPNVHRYRMALAEKSGTAEIHVSAGAYGPMASSLRSPKLHLVDVPDVTFETRVTVATTTLDDWAAARGVEQIDLLWLDMQGYELAALQASPRVLGTVRAIVTEVFGTEQYEGAPLVDEVTRWLAEHGFRVVELNMYWGISGDLLAVRDD
jgi:FkbM family methyltransferase